MSSEDEHIAASIASIETRIAESLLRAGRVGQSVQIVAVSKKQPLSKMRAYQSFCRQRGTLPCFGENYVQEFESKRQELAQPFEAHLIGPLQRNKAKLAVRLFDVIESVHTPELAVALDTAARAAGKTQSVYLQVNISRDERKSGFAPESVAEFLERDMPRLANTQLVGLMTITREYPEREMVRPDFAALRELRQSLGRSELKLSMGMSDDFDIAVEEGADVVRIGTALFGLRQSNSSES